VSDDIVVEETLDIRINGKGRFLCMRLPGSDAELAVGLCFSAGLIQSFSDISGMRVPEDQSGVVEIFLHGDVPPADEPVNVITSSSGALGSRSQHDLLAAAKPLSRSASSSPLPWCSLFSAIFSGGGLY
jgi:formate dehydrogenase assembly factor FdhD